MKIPALTHLQFLLLSALAHQPKTGKELRDFLTKQSIRKSGPSFYQLMARMEEAGWIEGWYSQVVIDGQIIKERNYKMTPKGRQGVAQYRAFYEQCTEFGLEGGISYAT